MKHYGILYHKIRLYTLIFKSIYENLTKIYLKKIKYMIRDNNDIKSKNKRIIIMKTQITDKYISLFPLGFFFKVIIF